MVPVPAPGTGTRTRRTTSTTRPTIQALTPEELILVLADVTITILTGHSSQSSS